MFTYDDKESADYLLKGFKDGFKLDYYGPRIQRSFKNLISAKIHDSQVHGKICKGLDLGRIIGPFKTPPFSNLVLSPIGVVGKSDCGWRLITHLSYP